MLPADIDAGLERLPSLHVRESVCVLVVGLVAMNGKRACAAQCRNRIRSLVADADNWSLIAARNVDQRCAKAQPETELAESGGAEHVGLGRSHVLLLMILIGRFADDDL